MRQSVTIKGHMMDAETVGLTVLLDPTISHTLLLEEVAEQFQKSGRFFRNAQVVLSLEGREMSLEEENEVIQVIQDHAPFRISYVIDQNGESGACFARALAEVKQTATVSEEELNVGQFYRGTLRDGQRLEVDGDLVIIGDVLSGARVVAGGSVIVIGGLKGQIVAGTVGNPSCIVAMDMMPGRLRIGEVSLSGKDPAFDGGRHEPRIAYVAEGKMTIVPLDQFSVADL